MMAAPHFKNKIERAQHHIKDLVSEVQKFYDSNPFEIGFEREPIEQRGVYFITRLEKTPSIISLLTGDALQNLRSALDHIAFALFDAKTKNEADLSKIYFPIADDLEKFRKNRERNLPGISEEIIKAFDIVKPYRGGNDILWQLHKLNNIDKHRKIITAGSGVVSFDLMSVAIPHMPMFNQSLLKSMSPILLNVAEKQFPLEVGKKVFIDGPNAEINENIKLNFSVLIHEPGILEEAPLVVTLQKIHDAVNHVASIFSPLIYSDK